MNLMDASAIFNLFQTGKYSVLIVGTTLSRLFFTMTH